MCYEKENLHGPHYYSLFACGILYLWVSTD